MIIRIILVVAILTILIWFLKGRKTTRMKAGKKLGVLLFFVFAITTVLYPSLTDDMAHWVGVGRGADLLLYALSIAFVAFAINQYMRSKEEEQRIVELARKIAILEANQKNKS